MFKLNNTAPSSAGSEKSQKDGVPSARTVAQTLELADKARDMHDFAQAAQLYSQFLKERPDAAGIWIQRGHMLKEIGFYSRSAESYARAWSLDDIDADAALQMGHLAKVRGLFDEASAYYAKAIAFGHPAGAWITEEIRAISIPPAAVSATLRRPQLVLGKVRVYLSSDLGDVSRLGVGDLKSMIGAANYSYSFAQRGFVEAMTDLDIEFALVPNPEIITDIRDHSDASVNIHLGFYPPERIRLLKGAYNVLTMAWEFERFRAETEASSHHAFESPAKMLSIVDEIWSPSEFGSAALRGITAKPVFTVPSPIAVSPRMKPRHGKHTYRDLARQIGGLDRVKWVPLAILPRIQATMRDEASRRRSSIASILFSSFEDTPPVVFCMVFNVHDYRKNLRPVLDAFVRVAKERTNAYLLLKVNMLGEDDYVLNDRLFQHQLSYGNEMFPPLVSDRVWMTSDTFSREEMDRLYDIASFYVCSAHAEGQNLPLLEAMSRGVVPVSVMHTAMADYLTDSNAIAMRTHLRSMDLKLAHRYGMAGVQTNYLDSEEAYRQIDLASCLADDDYAKLSVAALDTIRKRFNAEALAAQIATTAQRAAAQTERLA